MTPKASKAAPKSPKTPTAAPKTPKSPKSPTAAPKVAGLVLTPGASAGREQSSLVAIDDALRGDGVRVERVDFPYHVAGRRAPDKPAVLMGTVVDAAEALAGELKVPGTRIALGGRSMGGRICSMAVAEGLPAAGLVLISYPLHPPGKPDKPRTEHLGSITVPCLFVSGTRDAFGTPEELEAATAGIPGKVRHIWIEGGDHSLRRKDEQVAAVVRSWILDLKT